MIKPYPQRKKIIWRPPPLYMQKRRRTSPGGSSRHHLCIGINVRIVYCHYPSIIAESQTQSASAAPCRDQLYHSWVQHSRHRHIPRLARQWLAHFFCERLVALASHIYTKDIKALFWEMSRSPKSGMRNTPSKLSTSSNVTFHQASRSCCYWQSFLAEC